MSKPIIFSSSITLIFIFLLSFFILTFVPELIILAFFISSFTTKEELDDDLDK